MYRCAPLALVSAIMGFLFYVLALGRICDVGASQGALATREHHCNRMNLEISSYLYY